MAAHKDEDVRMTERSWERTLHLRKVEVAERQFKTAVRLFFRRDDPVSVHALASAAVQVMSDLLEASGGGGITRNRHLFQEGKFKGWIQALKGPENYMKHADRDPGDMLELKTGIVPLILLEGALLLDTLTQRASPETRLFTVWMMKAYPNYFRLDGSEARHLDRLDENDFPSWLAALDDPTGELGRAAKDWKVHPMPKTPYDLFLQDRSGVDT